MGGALWCKGGRGQHSLREGLSGCEGLAHSPVAHFSQASLDIAPVTGCLGSPSCRPSFPGPGGGHGFLTPRDLASPAGVDGRKGEGSRLQRVGESPPHLPCSLWKCCALCNAPWPKQPQPGLWACTGLKMETSGLEKLGTPL